MVELDIAAAYQAVHKTEDGLELVPPEPWKDHGPAVVPSQDGVALPVDAVRVALLRAAGIEDTVALGDVLGMPPAKVCALEALNGFGNALKRLRMAAGLGSWRAHVESTVATGILPSGTVAPAPTQAAMLMELFGREEPKVQADDAPTKTVIVLTGEAMARVASGLAEARRPVVDVTPRSSAPSQDAELEKQRGIYHAKD